MDQPSVRLKTTAFVNQLLIADLYSYDATIPCFLKLPSYLAQTDYKNPVDASNGVFSYTKGWKGDMFHYYEHHPVEGESFNHIMGGRMANQSGWVDIFPADTLLDHAKPDSEAPLLVDVGGSIGHDIERFREKYPETASRLYLEDRPEVIKHSKCPDPVHKVSYDFFTPQPIRGKNLPTTSSNEKEIKTHNNESLSLTIHPRCPRLLPPRHPTRLVRRARAADPPQPATRPHPPVQRPSDPRPHRVGGAGASAHDGVRPDDDGHGGGGGAERGAVGTVAQRGGVSGEEDLEESGGGAGGYRSGIGRERGRVGRTES